jgi:hypothetical protein
MFTILFNDFFFIFRLVISVEWTLFGNSREGKTNIILLNDLILIGKYYAHVFIATSTLS